MKFALGTVGFGLLHFIVSYLVGFTAGTTGGKAAKVLSNILTFPISVLPEPKNAPDWLGWVVWVGTSLLWGAGITLLLRTLLTAAKAG